MYCSQNQYPSEVLLPQSLTERVQSVALLIPPWNLTDGGQAPEPEPLVMSSLDNPGPFQLSEILGRLKGRDIEQQQPEVKEGLYRHL